MYYCADIVLVGKSFDPNIGGQNMIEPAAIGKPVIVGPHTENFVPVMNCFKANNAMIILSNISELEQTLRELISSPEKRKQWGEAAREVVDSQRGSLERSAIEIIANM
jgi:3-deoxy-D-manno-octulosonic-acid transferase